MSVVFVIDVSGQGEAPKQLARLVSHQLSSVIIASAGTDSPTPPLSLFTMSAGDITELSSPQAAFQQRFLAARSLSNRVALTTSDVSAGQLARVIGRFAAPKVLLVFVTSRVIAPPYDPLLELLGGLPSGFAAEILSYQQRVGVEELSQSINSFVTSVTSTRGLAFEVASVTSVALARRLRSVLSRGQRRKVSLRLPRASAEEREVSVPLVLHAAALPLCAPAAASGAAVCSVSHLRLGQMDVIAGTSIGHLALRAPAPPWDMTAIHALFTTPRHTVSPVCLSGPPCIVTTGSLEPGNIAHRLLHTLEQCRLALVLSVNTRGNALKDFYVLLTTGEGEGEGEGEGGMVNQRYETAMLWRVLPPEALLPVDVDVDMATRDSGTESDTQIQAEREIEALRAESCLGSVRHIQAFNPLLFDSGIVAYVEKALSQKQQTRTPTTTRRRTPTQTRRDETPRERERERERPRPEATPSVSSRTSTPSTAHGGGVSDLDFSGIFSKGGSGGGWW
ncbi:hypothetical protein KIPB_000883 [Kipferlia bialata]|uniref:Uncharacterized protein n=1 Tax=Kipferlia bialata TaxID=797122 RepID=A0A9K3CPT8_9EUKA|nr:hypothetical protein KIPB_000883 [Kipferlia bialata]|eukprot:g883.t1